nr:redoxin domain-containing protein [Lacticaseibacillus porcinae]
MEPFKADASLKGEFTTITDSDLNCHWSVVMFYPADFSFVCPTELEDLQDELLGNKFPSFQDLS